MLWYLCTIKDKLADFSQIVLYPNLNVAERDFKQFLNNIPTSSWQDFIMICVGSFRTDDGSLLSYDEVVKVATGKEVLEDV